MLTSPCIMHADLVSPNVKCTAGEKVAGIPNGIIIWHYILWFTQSGSNAIYANLLEPTSFHLHCNWTKNSSISADDLNTYHNANNACANA